jgi:excisionase family DNA binding protein
VGAGSESHDFVTRLVRLPDMTETMTPSTAVRPVYLTTEDIAARYGVNEDTARRWIRQKRLPAIRIGGAYRVRLDDLMRLERYSQPDGGTLSLTTDEPF